MKKRILALLLSAVMVIGLLPTAALAAEDTATLADAAAQAVTQKTTEAETFKTEMESFRDQMERTLKTPGEERLTALETNIGAVRDKWEAVPAVS